MATHFTILILGEPSCPPGGASDLARALVEARRALSACRPDTRARVIASDGRSWDMAVEAHGVVIDLGSDLGRDLGNAPRPHPGPVAG
ncbi:MAG TPA: hypothetical protein H9903_12275 [Candidatus Aquabacterium excrementipullorum]|nr:hypothetical protein [Candidatus Aquabacterium excrementipullorum]